MQKKGGNSVINVLQCMTTYISGLLAVRSSSAQRSKYGHLFFLMPVILGGVFIAIMVGNYGSDKETIIACVVVSLASIFIGWLLHYLHCKAVNALLCKHQESSSSATSFYSRVFPVWSKQITTSRNVGDSAVAELTILFGKIVSRLEAMLAASVSSANTRDGDKNCFLDAIANSQADIQSVFEDLKTALATVNDSKDMILAEVTMYSANMKEMAFEAQQVAMQSQIIALNAEIEAARAGDSGKAFAAVVSEMRQLSTKSGETSKDMSKKVESIDAAMSRFYDEDRKMTDMESLHVSRAEKIFNDVLERFNKTTLELKESISTMEDGSRKVRNDISNALVALQFQDRLSQILTHVADNINALSDFTEAGVRNLDADTWLGQMENKFSVDEEYDNLRGKSATIERRSLLTMF